MMDDAIADYLERWKRRERADLRLRGVPSGYDEELPNRVIGQSYPAFELVNEPGAFEGNSKAGKKAGYPGRGWRHETPRARELADVIEPCRSRMSRLGVNLVAATWTTHESISRPQPARRVAGVRNQAGQLWYPPGILIPDFVVRSGRAAYRFRV